MRRAPIPGHPGYEASDDGRIFSIARVVSRSGGGTYTVSEKELKQKINTRGYAGVKLLPVRKNSSQVVHRLVMLALSEPDPLRPDVNHIDGNKLNNKLSNLEWTNKSENAIHAYKVLKVAPAVAARGSDSRNAKAVVGVDEKTGNRREFACMTDAKSIGCTVSGISGALSGHQKTHRGMRWEKI